MSAALSQKRAMNILQLLTRFSMAVSLQYRVVLRLIGMLTAATVVIALCLVLRPLQLWNMWFAAKSHQTMPPTDLNFSP